MVSCEEHAAGSWSKDRALIQQLTKFVFHDMDYTVCRRAEQPASSALTEFPLAYHIEELSQDFDNVGALIVEALDLLEPRQVHDFVKTFAILWMSTVSGMFVVGTGSHDITMGVGNGADCLQAYTWSGNGSRGAT